MALPLPPHTTPRDGSDLLWAIVPALLGAASRAGWAVGLSE